MTSLTEVNEVSKKAEPKRPLCGMKRGGSVASHRVQRAKAKLDDNDEPDRSERSEQDNGYPPHSAKRSGAERKA